MRYRGHIWRWWYFYRRSRPAYYVDATSGSDSNNGLSPGGAWQTISKVNGLTFDPNDKILFKRGEIWQEQLTIPSSGTLGKPITFGAYGSGAKPIIDGSIEVSGPWNDEGSNVWSATLTTDPLGVVVIDGSVGTLVADAGSVNDPGEFFWEANTLYVYSVGEPTSIYAANRAYTVYAAAKSYIILDGLHQRYSKNNCTRFETSGSNRIIKNCIAEYSAQEGINMVSDGSAANDEYYNNIIRYCQEGGLRNSTIQNVVIHHNSVYENWTRTAVQGDQIRCIGVNAGLIIHHNYVHRPATVNNNDGIDLASDCDGAEVYYNLILGNFSAKNGTLNVKLFNNVIYDVHSDIDGVVYFDGGGNNGAEIKNNIVWCKKSGGRAMLFGPSSQTNPDFNNNCLYAPDGHVGYWDSANKTTLANWRTATSQDADSISEDPLFVNAGAENFRLQSGSPCRNVGADVGLNQDYVGVSVPQETNPAIGAYEYVG